MSDIDKTADILHKWVETFIHQSFSDFLCYGKRHDLSMSQISVLFQLGHFKVSTVSQIADNLGITSAAVSQMLDSLVRQGLVTRREDPGDRRMKKIELSAKGREMIEEIMRAKKHWFKTLSERMNPAERSIVREGLKILIEKAEKVELRSQQKENDHGEESTRR